MASKLEHSVGYPFSTARLWEVISTEKYWYDLIAATNADHGRVDGFKLEGDTITVDLQQGIAADKLPSAITAIHSGDIEIPRRSTFTLVDGVIRGDIKASVNRAPAKVDGTVETSGDPATTTYRASVDVSIPFVGGKIEKAVIAQLTELLDREREHTEDWEAANR